MVVPDIFDSKPNPRGEVAPQGYYRSGEGNVSFFLVPLFMDALLFEDGIDATRAIRVNSVGALRL